jgi:hypothetical protein
MAREEGGAMACEGEVALSWRRRRRKREKGNGLVGRLRGQMANGPGKETKIEINFEFDF